MQNKMIILAAVAMLAGCATQVPRTIVTGPTTVRPAARSETLPANGSIYQARASRGLFEDTLARNVGDLVTVQIEESVNATTKADNSAERTSTVSNALSAGATSDTINGLMKGFNVANSGNNKFGGKGSTTANNSFNGTITTTVSDVLPNGNLLIAGERQVNIRGEVSYVRLSGVINPADIKNGVISSTRVSEARIEEVGSGTVAQANKAGWLQDVMMRFFPF
ncbi:flagellar basal body L-ring protein FlgH [Burkholderiaceae bacterium DAT-1]|nr:flagellar basal body L-ring protein FlgH [Burkholderiaceae bacterium DAT-1]